VDEAVCVERVRTDFDGVEIELDADLTAEIAEHLVRLRNTLLAISKEFGKVNLNNRDLYNSPYYYLHNNDIVYVEPGKGKAAQSDKIYQILPIILSALSFLTIIVTYTRK